ncbi:hypothetical protein OQA88_11193 [Cercophora sp. LCS_1]
MFLGVNQHWRVLPQFTVARGSSVIPRSLLHPTCPPSCPPRRHAHDASAASRDSQPEDAEPPTQPDTPPEELADRLADIPVRQHGKLGSVLIPPDTVYPHQAETRRARSKIHRLSGRQDHIDKYYLAKKSSIKASNDWREILTILIAATPHNPPPKEVDFEKTQPAPQDAAADLAGAIKWTSYLVDDLQTGIVRPYACHVRPADIPKPEQWTKESLEVYVGKLVMGQPRRNLRAYKDSHAREVGHELVTTFMDPAVVPALSLPAFKLAITHLIRHESLRGDAIKLLRRVTALGMRVDAQAFNILLEGTTNRNNLWLFYCILKPMVRQGLQPDLLTWIMFFRIIKAEEVRRYILIIMGKIGLTKLPGAMAVVAAESVVDDVHRAVRLDYSFEEFIAQVRSVYQSGWLSNSWGNRALNAFGSHGRLEDMHKVLELMFASEATRPRGRVPLTTVLTHCRLHRAEFNWPVRFIQLFEQHELPFLCQQDYECLFKMAYFMNKPQVLGVVWRHAMLAGKTTYYMRSRVLRLLRGEGRESLYGLLEKLSPGKSSESEPEPEPGLDKRDELKHGLGLQDYIKRMLFWDFMNLRRHAARSMDKQSAHEFVSKAMFWYRQMGYKLASKGTVSRLLEAADARDKQIVDAVANGRDFSLTGVPIFTWRRKPAVRKIVSRSLTRTSPTSQFRSVMGRATRRKGARAGREARARWVATISNAEAFRNAYRRRGVAS